MLSIFKRSNTSLLGIHSQVSNNGNNNTTTERRRLPQLDSRGMLSQFHLHTFHLVFLLAYSSTHSCTPPRRLPENYLFDINGEFRYQVICFFFFLYTFLSCLPIQLNSPPEFSKIDAISTISTCSFFSMYTCTPGAGDQVEM